MKISIDNLTLGFSLVAMQVLVVLSAVLLTGQGNGI